MEGIINRIGNFLGKGIIRLVAVESMVNEGCQEVDALTCAQSCSKFLSDPGKADRLLTETKWENLTSRAKVRFVTKLQELGILKKHSGLTLEQAEEKVEKRCESGLPGSSYCWKPAPKETIGLLESARKLYNYAGYGLDRS